LFSCCLHLIESTVRGVMMNGAALGATATSIF